MTHEPTEPVVNTKSSNIDSILYDAQILTEAIHTEPGSATEAVEFKNEVMREIVAPEGLATAANLEASHLLTVAGEMLVTIEKSSRLIVELADGMDKGVREVTENLPNAKRAIHEIRDIVSDRRGFDFDAARHRLSALSRIAEAYPSSRRQLVDKSDAIQQHTRQLSVASEEGLGSSKKAFKNITSLEREAEESPESMYFEGLEAKVVERGETNASEHKASCEKDINDADRLCGELSNRFGELGATASDIAAAIRVKNSGVDDLPSAMQLVDSFDQLKSYLHRLEQRGPEFARSVMRVIDDTEIVIRRLEVGVNSVSIGSRRVLKTTEAINGSVQSIKAVINR